MVMKKSKERITINDQLKERITFMKKVIESFKSRLNLKNHIFSGLIIKLRETTKLVLVPLLQ